MSGFLFCSWFMKKVLVLMSYFSLLGIVLLVFVMNRGVFA